MHNYRCVALRALSLWIPTKCHCLGYRQCVQGIPVLDIIVNDLGLFFAMSFHIG